MTVVTRMLVGGFLASDSVAMGEGVIVNAWLVRHPKATVLIDTGIGENIPPEDLRDGVPAHVTEVITAGGIPAA